MIFAKLVFLLMAKVAVSDHSSSNHDVQQIKESGKIRITGSSSDSSYDQHFEKFCFTISTQDKNKRIAYEQSVQTLNRIQRYFKKKDLIPDEKSLIVRKFDARINRKWRVWVVVKQVCFLAPTHQHRFIEKSLRQLGVQQFHSLPVGSLHDERELAMKAFNNAKHAALAILEPIDFKILKVSNIEILGNYVYQEEKLEEEIEDEFNNGEDSQEDRLSSGEEDDDQKELSADDKDSSRRRKDVTAIEVSVVFEVGPHDQEQSTSTQQL